MNGHKWRASGGRRLKPCLILALVLLSAVIASAQDESCPARQNEAQANILAHCAEQEAGTLCLGHPTVSAVWRANTAAAPFLHPGDTSSIVDIDWLSVSSEAETWGTARAVFSAYPGDGLETTPSALLAIGNVALFLPELPTRPATGVRVKVSAAQGAYLREAPDTEARAIAPISASSDLMAVGRSADRQWFFGYAAPELRGWISREVVTDPSSQLPEMAIDVASPPLWLPGQTFDFRSGIDDAPCDGAPESGILLQTPKFVSPRHFEINGARVSIGGTVWLQAQVSAGMQIHALDGAVRVSVREQAVNLTGGRYTTVPLEREEDGGMRAAGPPAEPAAYDYHALVRLPVQLLLYESRVGLDVYAVAAPVPEDGGSPLDNIGPEDECRISAALFGANIRRQPDPEAPIIAVMAYRESAKPLARGIGSDRLPWWKLDEGIWVRVDATVSGGNCNDVPLVVVSN